MGNVVHSVKDFVLRPEMKRREIRKTGQLQTEKTHGYGVGMKVDLLTSQDSYSDYLNYSYRP